MERQDCASADRVRLAVRLALAGSLIAGLVLFAAASHQASVSHDIRR